MIIDYPLNIFKPEFQLKNIVSFQLHSSFSQYFDYDDFLYFMYCRNRSDYNFSFNELICCFYFNTQLNILLFACGTIKYHMHNGLLYPMKIILSDDLQIEIPIDFGKKIFFVLPDALNKKRYCLDIWDMEDNNYFISFIQWLPNEIMNEMFDYLKIMELNKFLFNKYLL